MPYYSFKSEDGQDYGSFEVFQVTATTRQLYGYELDAGWYWQSGFPGCLPDGDHPVGPFATEELAVANARED